MKKIFTTLMLYSAILLNSKLNAQTYPYSENFDAVPDSTIPSNYNVYLYCGSSNSNSVVICSNGGTVERFTVKTLPNKGVANSKALISKHYTSTITEDSVITAPIGLLNTSSSLSFDYSFLLTAACGYTDPTIPNSFSRKNGQGNPSCSNSLNYKVYVIDLSSGASTLVYTLDSTNHTPAMSYNQVNITLLILTQIGCLVNFV